jgi:DNA (cytosine-5)-methyltransferase 1
VDRYAEISREVTRALVPFSRERSPILKQEKARSVAIGIAKDVSLNTPSVAAKKYTGPIQVIDLFSGCGGMSYGFAAISEKTSSYRIVAAVDIDAYANKTYQRNIGIAPKQLDLATIARSKSSIQEFLSTLDILHSEPCILIGCAPCQGFSSHRKKHWNLPTDTRNSLIDAFARIAASLQPDVVVMENVPELLSAKYWAHFSELKGVLQKAGYLVRARVVNTAGFGVPQERFRALVIAMKRRFSMPLPYLFPTDYRTVRNAIGSLPSLEPGIPNPEDPMHVTTRHRASTIKTITHVPKNGGSRPVGIGPACLDRVKGFYDVYGRLAWDKPAITITGYSRNPASGRYVHPEQDRGLSIREAALLQSFPLNYAFEGPFDNKFMQIGNAVPPALSAYLAGFILGELCSYPREDPFDDETEDIRDPISNSYSSVIAGMKFRREVSTAV